MPWGAKQNVVNIDQTIGTLSGLKVEVLAPISAETGTLNLNYGNGLGMNNGSLLPRLAGAVRLESGSIGVGVNSAGPLRVASGSLVVRTGGGIGLTSGTLQARLGSPLRLSAGSIGHPTGGGLGLTGGTLQARIAGAVRLESGSIGVGVNSAGPLRVASGSLVVRTGGGIGLTSGTLQARLTGAVRLESGSIGVGVNSAGPLRVASGSLVARTGGGIGLTSGTLQARTGGGIGLTNGTIQARLLGPVLRTSSGSIGIAPGSVGTTLMKLNSVDSSILEMSRQGFSLLLDDFDIPSAQLTNTFFGTLADTNGSVYVPPRSSIVRIRTTAAGSGRLNGRLRWDPTLWRRLDMSFRGSVLSTATHAGGLFHTLGFSDQRYDGASNGGLGSMLACFNLLDTGAGTAQSQTRTYSEAITATTFQNSNRATNAYRIELGTTQVRFYVNDTLKATHTGGLPGTRLTNFLAVMRLGAGSKTTNLDFIHVRGIRLVP